MVSGLPRVYTSKLCRYIGQINYQHSTQQTNKHNLIHMHTSQTHKDDTETYGSHKTYKFTTHTHIHNWQTHNTQTYSLINKQIKVFKF